MPTLVVIGQVYQVGETQTVGNNGFEKRELIIKTVEEYLQYIKIDFLQGNVDKIAPDLMDHNVKVSCKLGGRLYTRDSGDVEVFNSLVGWKVEFP